MTEETQHRSLERALDRLGAAFSEAAVAIGALRARAELRAAETAAWALERRRYIWWWRGFVGDSRAIKPSLLWPTGARWWKAGRAAGRLIGSPTMRFDRKETQCRVS